MTENELAMSDWLVRKEAVFVERTELVAVVLGDDPAWHHITHFILSHNFNSI